MEQYVSTHKTFFYHNAVKKMEMEVFFPSDDLNVHPTVVFFYGGGFSVRRRENFYKISDILAQKGYVCINPDYSLASELPLKDCYEDGFYALQAIINQQQKLKVDLDNLFVGGNSSGGSVAARIALLTDKVKGTILVAPGLAWQYQQIEYVEKANSGMEQIIALESQRHQDWEQAYYLLENHQLPDTLILQGTGDEVCYRGNSLFQRKALDLGYSVTMVLYEGQPHGFLKYNPEQENEIFDNAVKRIEKFLYNTINK